MRADRYIQRLADPFLDELMAQLPALLLVGPRAGGKTTTARRRAATVIRLDKRAESAAFEADPDAALRGLDEPVLLDEWQAVPGVLGAVRRAVDLDPHPGRFIVTGSVRSHLIHDIWPATGRLVRVALYPMTVREQLARTGGPNFFDQVAGGGDLIVPRDSPDLRGYLTLALRGGFPYPALHLQGEPRRAWLESYVDDLLTHDVEQLGSPGTRRRDPQRLRRYLDAYALNSAGIADHKAVFDAAGVSRVAAEGYEGLLADLFVVERVPAWTSNRLKRLRGRPKRYLIDSGVFGAVLRLDESAVIHDGDLLGRLLDTFVVEQLRGEVAASKTRPSCFHIRTEQGRQEIDLVAELGGRRIVGIEVKATSAPARDDVKHLLWLRDRLPDRFVAGVLFHTGPSLFEIDERIVAAPISVLWGQSRA